MVTRCPSCGTLFRVTPQHLQAYHGQVRCGRCMTVFDGFQALATLPDQGPSESAPRAVAEGAAETGRARFAPPHSDTPGIQAEPVGKSQGAVGSDAAAGGLAGTPGDASAASEAAAAAGVPAYAAGSGEGAQQEALAGGSAQAAAVGPWWRRGALGWSAGVAILVLGLAGQAIYAWRVDLVASYPVLRPAVVQLCNLVGCTVALPQRPKLISIEASDLQVQDQTRPGLIQLTATLRNHAAFEVGYPALDLVLTNTKEHTLARRVFSPEEYLEPRRNGPSGLAANAEATIRLVLDTGDLGAAGFRLALLPAR